MAGFIVRISKAEVRILSTGLVLDFMLSQCERCAGVEVSIKANQIAQAVPSSALSMNAQERKQLTWQMCYPTLHTSRVHESR